MKLNYIDTVPTLIHFCSFLLEWKTMNQNQAQVWHSQPVLEEKKRERMLVVFTTAEQNTD